MALCFLSSEKAGHEHNKISEAMGWLSREQEYRNEAKSRQV